MLLNNKLEESLYKTDVKELKDYENEFKFAYNKNNTEAINGFLEFLSIAKGKPEHFSALFELNDNPFIVCVSICDCGHIHAYSKTDLTDKDNESYFSREEIKYPIVCPNCNKEFSDTLRDACIDANEFSSINYLFQVGEDVENKLLYFNIYDYYIKVSNEEIIISTCLCDSIILGLDNYKFKHNPFGYAGFYNGYIMDTEGSNTILNSFVKDLCETIFNFNKKFKEFAKRIDSNITKEHQYSLKELNKTYILYIENKEYLIGKSATFENKFINYYINKEKNFNERIDDFFDNMHNIAKSLFENIDISDKFLELFKDRTVDYKNLDNISRCFNIIKTIDDSGTYDYLKNYIHNYCKYFEMGILFNLYDIFNKYENIDIGNLIKYIIRGATNENLSIEKVMSYINDINDYKISNSETLITINGSFKSKLYNKYCLLKKIGNNNIEILDELEKKNNFDGFYKKIMSL